jgi:hypothetical protein
MPGAIASRRSAFFFFFLLVKRKFQGRRRIKSPTEAKWVYSRPCRTPFWVAVFFFSLGGEDYDALLWFGGEGLGQAGAERTVV